MLRWRSGLSRRWSGMPCRGSGMSRRWSSVSCRRSAVALSHPVVIVTPVATVGTRRLLDAAAVAVELRRFATIVPPAVTMTCVPATVDIVDGRAVVVRAGIALVVRWSIFDRDVTRVRYATAADQREDDEYRHAHGWTSPCWGWVGESPGRLSSDLGATGRPRATDYASTGPCNATLPGDSPTWLECKLDATLLRRWTSVRDTMGAAC